MEIKYKMVNKNASHPVKKGHDADSQLTAGINLYSTVKVRINSNSFEVIPTGVAFEIPNGKMGLLKARSGFTVKTGIVVNAGVIDSNYRGEVKVVLNNPTGWFVDIFPGDGVAQMLILPVPKTELKEVEELSTTERGDRGFSSTDD